MSSAGNQWGFNGESRWAHGGMLKAALHIRNELDRSSTLRNIFKGTHSSFHTPLTEVRHVNQLPTSFLISSDVDHRAVMRLPTSWW